MLSCPSGKLRTEFPSLIVKYPLALGYLTLHVLSLNAGDHKNVVVLARQYFMLEQEEWGVFASQGSALTVLKSSSEVEYQY